MVITVSCPACETSFPADPNKIPEAGVKVRCSQCAHVFRVERPVEEAPAEASPEPTLAPDDGPSFEPDASEPDQADADGGVTEEAGADQAADAGTEETAAAESAADEWTVERDPFETADAEQPAEEPTSDDVPDGGAELPDWASAGGDEISLVDAPEVMEPEEAVAEPELEAPEPELDESPLDEALNEVDPLPELGISEPDTPEAVIEDTLPEVVPEETLPEPELAEVLPEPGLEEVLPEPEPLPEPVVDEAPTAPTDAPVQGFTFGKRDPMDKARRLARVLVSDMVMYNAERHQVALSRGTLAEDFEEEIDKSWKEYVDQLGNEIADGEGQRFWTQALNDILAKGEEVF